jgi:RimJ/RimL family protein N-acetyltransferase
MHIIETERLKLRPLTHDDLDALAAINSDPQVMRYISDGNPAAREHTAERLNFLIEHGRQYGFGAWAVLYKSSLSLIGFCALIHLDGTTEVEVGYRLARNQWGNGFATEAARASLRHGFEDLALERIVAVVQPDNLASQRVLEKLSLKYEKDARYYNTEVKYYAIAREAYEPDGSFYSCKPQA